MKSSLPCWVHASSSGTEPQPQTCKSWPVPQPSCTQQGPTVALRSQITVHEARRTWNPLANSTHLLLHPVTDFLFLLGPKCTALFLWDFMELLEIILTVREVCICLSELSCSQWDAIGIWVLLLERTKVKRGNKNLIISTWERILVTQQHSLIMLRSGPVLQQQGSNTITPCHYQSKMFPT